MIQYYNIENIRQLKKVAPENYTHLTNCVTGIHDIWSQYRKVSTTDNPWEIMLTYLDLVDQTDRTLNELDKAHKVFLREFHRPLLHHIENYGQRRVTIQIALSLYGDVTFIVCL